ncbi:M15 family metallopeptidase [Treponema berlinense]|uniref:M15 family metallopeptidase n=1 Tax=Treponema berlinense TaxID=225004 RepID=UPI0026F03A8C|nr:M15 family metallopeptidase [Treponema berlinense]
MKKFFLPGILVFWTAVFCPAQSEKLFLTEEAFLDREFCICSISDEIFEKIYGKSFKEDCTVPRENLRLVKVLHKNLEGQTLQGELICSEKIAGILLKIFRELYLEGYPIEKIRLVDEYEADDEKSMADNNSSCFNFRFISFTKKISKHGEGLAVDINPLYNPYIKKVGDRVNVEPANALPYSDRTADFPYKIRKGDAAYRLFTENGFEWGGDWQTVKDYQHFEWKE